MSIVYARGQRCFATAATTDDVGISFFACQLATHAEHDIVMAKPSVRLSIWLGVWRAL